MSDYLKPNRLGDVIAAIQATATYKFYKLDFEGWADRISADTGRAGHWRQVFEEHPEFFRLDSRREKTSLVWRRQYPRRYNVDLEKALGKAQVDALPEGARVLLRMADVAIGRRQITVRLSDWNGQVTAPKGGRTRVIPMTRRLAETLQRHRHLRGPLVLCERDGSPSTRQKIQTRVKRAARRAGLSRFGVHMLRHTFCSHLAMRVHLPGAFRSWPGTLT